MSGNVPVSPRTWLALGFAAALASMALAAPEPLYAQAAFSAADPGPRPPAGPYARMPSGVPDLSGNWSIAVSIGNIAAHIASIGGAPVGDGARAIPYTPVYAALAAETPRRLYEEPELHCYMSGVPSHLWRQAYSGAGLIIQQTEDYVVFHHEFQGSRRIVPLSGRAHIPAGIRLFMGDGVGHWEGNTLVIETANNNAITWLDTAGNRHSDRLVVTERFTPIMNDAYDYEATFVDPVAYTAAWTIAARMTRGQDPNAEILEFACIEGNTDHLHYPEDVGGNAAVAPHASATSPTGESR